MATLTATLQPTTTPPSVQLSVTNGGVEFARIKRYSASGVSEVRTPNGRPLTLLTPGGSGSLVDYEAPFGESVTYQLVSATNNAVLASTSPTSLVVADPWLVHVGFPQRSQRIDLRAGSFASRSRGTTRAVLKPLGRKFPLVVTGSTRPAQESSMIVRTSTLAQLDALDTLLADDSVLLLNVPRALNLGFPTCYISVGDLEEVRPSDVGADAYRDWKLPFLVTSAPISATGITTGPTPGGGTGGGEVPPGGRTYADEALAHNTYQAAKTAHPTYADAFTGEG